MYLTLVKIITEKYLNLMIFLQSLKHYNVMVINLALMIHFFFSKKMSLNFKWLVSDAADSPL